MNEYYPRIMDEILDDYLEAFGAVLIKGLKWCGKTTTAEQHANSVIKLQDPDNSASYLQMANFMPLRLLEGKTPRLIDEWQMAPSLWDAVRNAVDVRGKEGQFILTESTVVNEDAIMHSGTGRIAQLNMSTMSLFESRESNGSVSLAALFNKEKLRDGISSLSVEDLAYAICRGGWPAAIGKKRAAALLIAQSYVDSICSTDASSVDRSSKNPERVRSLLRSYSRNISTLATNSSILKDMWQNDIGINETTMYKYISALKQLYVIQELPAWNPAIRSATAMRSANKKGFSDPSIAAAALGLGPEQLLDNLNTFGFFFESLCIRDLSVYSSALGGHISYYHDRYGLECDIVLHLRDGRYGLIEVKLGSKEIEEGVSHLLKLEGLIKDNKMRLPSFCMVLTGGEFAYQRDDGVYVVPIGCLKP